MNKLTEITLRLKNIAKRYYQKTMKISTKRMILRLIGLFSVVRGYNILLICIAQYVVAIFLLSENQHYIKVLLDDKLFMLILSGAFAISGGYIINSFYDFEKDIINKPFKSMIDRLVSQKTKLTVYFICNFLSILVAGYVSFRTVLFFSGYIFVMWLYSHRLKRLPFVGNVTSAFLSIIPFFAELIYYKNFSKVIFVHATLLFLLLLIKEFVKDLKNISGDFVHDYRTIPVQFGEMVSKISITLICLLYFIVCYILIYCFEVGYMIYYLFFMFFSMSFFIIILWKHHTKKYYILLHSLLKILLVLGVFSVSLIR